MENIMKKVIMAVFLVFMLFGCASLPKHMTVSTNININNDYKNAKIIFFRPSDNPYASARFIEINEIKNNNINYIGYLSFGSGIIYNAKPGKHVFALFNGLPKSYRWLGIFNWYYFFDSGFSHSFEIDVEAGKYYYVKVNSFKPAVVPINQSNIDKLDNLDNITWVYPNEQSKSVLDKNAEKYYKSLGFGKERGERALLIPDDKLQEKINKLQNNSAISVRELKNSKNVDLSEVLKLDE